MKIDKPILRLYSETEKTIEDSGLLPKERMDFLLDQIKEEKFEPVVLQNGKTIKNWCQHALLDEALVLINNEYNSRYNKERVLNAILTEEEINLLNEFANKLSQKKKEREKFEKAEKINPEDWNGPIHSDEIGSNDGYFQDIGELYDYCSDQEIDLVDYVWACYELPVLDKVGVDWLIERTEQHIPDDHEYTFEGKKELDEALKIFFEKNKGEVYWEPSYKKAIVLKKNE